jgi:hypothetical protein
MDEGFQRRTLVHNERAEEGTAKGEVLGGDGTRQ